MGGALGIAVMFPLFAAQGGYESARPFGDGPRPALAAGAAVVGLAEAAALVVPGRRTGAAPDARVVGRGCGERRAPAVAVGAVS
ncbi:hypothetical protein GCM10020295_32960 [Streptomyces cinereospinus]